MIKLSVLYPNAPDKSFDMDYYLNTHIPLVKRSLGAACKGISVDQGLAGGAPGSPATYHVVCEIIFDSIADMDAVMSQHGATLMADVPNYTNLQPSVQVSEVKL
ncbi:MAG: EthD family reductase [Bryobacteraceae bacterium]